MEERGGRESEEAVVRRGEEVGELGPSRGVVEGRVGGRRGPAGREGEEATCLLDFFGVCRPEGNEVLLGVGDGLEELGFGLGADELDVLLESEHELKLALLRGRTWSENLMGQETVVARSGEQIQYLPPSFEAPSCCQCTKPVLRLRSR